MFVDTLYLKCELNPISILIKHETLHKIFFNDIHLGSNKTVGIAEVIKCFLLLIE